MAHEVENMMYVSNESNNRFVPWHGLGVAVEKAPNSAEALKLAGLDWEVVPQPMFTKLGDGTHIEVPNCKANVRSSDNKVLGVVTDRYKIVQNKDAFDFTDNLIGDGCVYETAGSLQEGRRVFMLAKLPNYDVLGEDFEQFICFTNSHDGTGAVKAVVTPVRVVCQNTLSMALEGATRAWSTRHTGDIKGKMEEAKYALQMADKYMKRFEETADLLANTKVDEEEAARIIMKLFPTEEGMTDRRIENMKEQRDGFIACMLSPDLIKFKGTAYQMVQAASDFATHRVPQRNTSTYQEGVFKKVLDGSTIIDTTLLEMLKLAKGA